MTTISTPSGKYTLTQEAYLDNRTPQHSEQLPCAYRATAIDEYGGDFLLTWLIQMTQSEYSAWQDVHDGESPDFIEDGNFVDWDNPDFIEGI